MLPEFIVHGETGFVFDDLDDLAAKLRLLADNPDLVAKIGREASRVVRREYDLRVAGLKMAELYDQMLSQSNRSREAAA